MELLLKFSRVHFDSYFLAEFTLITNLIAIMTNIVSTRIKDIY